MSIEIQSIGGDVEGDARPLEAADLEVARQIGVVEAALQSQGDEFALEVDRAAAARARA